VRRRARENASAALLNLVGAQATASPSVNRQCPLFISSLALPRSNASRSLDPARALLPDRVTPFSFDADGDDHPREECGVFGVIGDPDASSLCYLGLQKLQHRGEAIAGNP
jgi:amidophosphoribosyltransferase